MHQRDQRTEEIGKMFSFIFVLVGSRYSAQCSKCFSSSRISISLLNSNCYSSSPSLSSVFISSPQIFFVCVTIALGILKLLIIFLGVVSKTWRNSNKKLFSKLIEIEKSRKSFQHIKKISRDMQKRDVKGSEVDLVRI